MIFSITRNVIRSRFGTVVTAADPITISRPQKTKIEIKREKIAQWPKIEDVAVLEYREYPYHITHNDPDTEDYIPDRKADYYARMKTDRFNYYLDRLKSDLRMQKEIDEALAKLDRPYLRGKAGVTRNITGGLKEYFPVDVGFPVPENNQGIPGIFDSKKFEYHPTLVNEKRWITQSIYLPKKPTYSNQQDLERLKEQRPVTRNYHPDKGSKYDVEVPYHQRYPYLADRLGHPEYVATPFERLVRLEGDLYHPVYNDQPFVQKPPLLPDESLNFEAGEVLYENRRLMEWYKFWQRSFYTVLLWQAFFMQYMIMVKTHIPLEAAYETNYVPYNNFSYHSFDYFKLQVPMYFGGGYFILKNMLKLDHMDAAKYVVKAQYSKDKELLFITKPSMDFHNVEEEIFETAHIEVVPPGTAHTHQFFSDTKADGFTVAYCLSTNRELFFKMDDHLWNPKLKKDFFVQHSQLFTKQHYGMKRKEATELAEAKYQRYNSQDETKYD